MAKLNVKNRTIFSRDNIDVMRGMTSDSVDLIYLDPPFNSNHNYATPLPGDDVIAEFKDIWYLSDIDEEWVGAIADEHPGLYKVIDAAGEVGGDSAKSYLIYMSIRLLEMHRILKKTGSLYLHCDPTMSHYLKIILDDVFGCDNFRREIIWSLETVSGFKSKANNWIRGHDTILYYTKTNDFTFNRQTQPHKPEYIKRFKKIDKDGRRYRDDRSGNRRQYLDSTEGRLFSDVWNDIMSFQQAATSSEIMGYPTQKPLALLERIIKSSSNPGDVVLDPFCGCATACIAADRLQRKWVGIDISPVAYTLINRRIERHAGLDLYREESKGWVAIQRTDTPVRKGKLSPDIKHKLFGIQEGECNGCGHTILFQNLEKDHIVPKSKGGQNIDSNLQLLCGSCNRIKGGRLTMEELWAELKKRGHTKIKTEIRKSRFKMGHSKD